MPGWLGVRRNHVLGDAPLAADGGNVLLVKDRLVCVFVRV